MMSSGSTGTNSVYTPNVFNTNKKTTTSSVIPEKPVEMKQPEFANSGSNYEKHLNDKLKKEEIGISADREFYRRDSDLGTFKTISKTVTIYYRDYGDVDQDFIRIYLNGDIIKPMVFLEADYHSFSVDLQKGSNKIEFEALNVGFGFPNTADFMVTDELGNRITNNMWALDTGFKAIITIDRS